MRPLLLSRCLAVSGVASRLDPVTCYLDEFGWLGNLEDAAVACARHATPHGEIGLDMKAPGFAVNP